MTAVELNVDRILWDWWKLDQQDDDSSALVDLLDLFLINEEDMDFEPWNSNMTRSIKVVLPKEKLKKVEAYTKKHGWESFINGCLKWARLEEEKLKAQFHEQDASSVKN